MYPTREVIDHSLAIIQRKIDRAGGNVLFIDQRQLLTFGFVHDVPLIVDYDKKVLIERALSSNREYYETFYKDLENHRFPLIITQPLNTPKKGQGVNVTHDGDDGKANRATGKNPHPGA